MNKKEYYRWESKQKLEFCFQRIIDIISPDRSEFEINLDCFSDNLLKVTQQVNFDAICSMDVVSLVPAQKLSIRDNAPLIVDYNEFPVLSLRTGRVFKNMKPGQLRRLNSRINVASNHVNAAISYSRAIGRIAHKQYAISSTPILNFHKKLNDIVPFDVKTELGLKLSDRLVVHNCSYAKEYGSEKVLYVLENLPLNFHLVMVGSAISTSFERQFLQLSRSLNLDDRVHFKDDITSPEQYLEYLAGADVGLIVMDAEVPNIRFGLSNRFTDLVAAGVPIVSSHLPESNRLIKNDGNGSVVSSGEPKEIASKIVELTEMDPFKKATLKNASEVSRQKYTWDNECEKFLKIFTQGILSHNKQQNPLIAFIFPRGVIKNRRVFRLADKLTEAGMKTAIFAGTQPANNVLKMFPKVGFFRIPMKISLTRLEVKILSEDIESFYNDK